MARLDFKKANGNDKEHFTIDKEIQQSTLNQFQKSITMKYSHLVTIVNEDNNEFTINLKGEKKSISKELHSMKNKVIVFKGQMTNEYIITYIALIKDLLDFCFDPFPSNLIVRFHFSSMETKADLSGANVIYSLLYSPIPFNTFHCISNEMKYQDSFEIIIHGKGGHSSLPYLCLNPINAGTELIMRINKMQTQEIEPKRQYRIHISEFKSGQAPNVIPDTATIKGAVYTNEEGNDNSNSIVNQVKEITELVCQSNKVTSTFFYKKTIDNHKEYLLVKETITSQFNFHKDNDLNIESIGSSMYFDNNNNNTQPEVLIHSGYLTKTNDNKDILISTIELLEGIIKEQSLI